MRKDTRRITTTKSDHKYLQGFHLKDPASLPLRHRPTVGSTVQAKSPRESCNFHALSPPCWRYMVPCQKVGKRLAILSHKLTQTIFDVLYLLIDAS